MLKQDQRLKAQRNLEKAMPIEIEAQRRFQMANPDGGPSTSGLVNLAILGAEIAQDRRLRDTLQLMDEQNGPIPVVKVLKKGLDLPLETVVQTGTPEEAAEELSLAADAELFG